MTCCFGNRKTFRSIFHKISGLSCSTTYGVGIGFWCRYGVPTGLEVEPALKTCHKLLRSKSVSPCLRRTYPVHHFRLFPFTNDTPSMCKTWSLVEMSCNGPKPIIGTKLGLTFRCVFHNLQYITCGTEMFHEMNRQPTSILFNLFYMSLQLTLITDYIANM